MDLQGRSVIVTGGGSGIGAACAARLASDGAAVTICGRTESKLQEVAGRTGCRYVVADVTVEDDVRRLVDAAGDVYGVVANAGGGGPLAPLHLQDVQTFLYVLHLNVLGTFLLVKHAVPKMVTGGGGSFVGMSSIAAGLTHPWFGAYPAAKAGIEAIVRNAADEYGEAGVRFNAVRPGFTATELMDLIPRESPVYESYIANTPMRDVGRPEDVAELVRFLISPASRWITGEIITVDGGHSLRRGPDFSMFTGLSRDALLAKEPRSTP